MYVKQHVALISYDMLQICGHNKKNQPAFIIHCKIQTLIEQFW